MISEAVNMDCMEYMSRFPDKFFDLACVDPPYGIGYSMTAAKMSMQKFGKAAAHKSAHKMKPWDEKPPSNEYFIELIRVSKNQIIWGANHFISKIPYDSSCWIVWDKRNENTCFADAELAWTSLKSTVRKFSFRWNGMIQEDMKNKEKRFHPTQKPVQLYRWIFKNYAQSGFKILDTHLGSGSSRIAAHDMKNDFYSCEIDLDYFIAAQNRFSQYVSQLSIL